MKVQREPVTVTGEQATLYHWFYPDIKEGNWLVLLSGLAGKVLVSNDPEARRPA